MAEMIGPYQVVERLGVGGMGEVYKAFDDRLERWVAIKRIRTDKETADEHRERFQREARATARLNHSSIVHVYDIFRDGDSDCIVMEYVEGRTLDKLVVEGSLTPLKVAKLGEEISSGLTEAHAKGILHRDLKVENIIVTPDGHAKILDFGLAKPILRGDLDSSLTGKGQLVGTSRAMAPEYVSGEEVDRRSDLFSLGVLLYEAATGHSPFKSHNTLATLKQVMLYRQTPAHQLNPHLPTEMSDLIDRLLEKDPAKRPQDAEEVAQEFRLIVDKLSSETVPRPSSGAVLKSDSSFLTPTATATSLDLWIPRRRWWLLAAVLIAVLGSAFLLSRVSPKVLAPTPESEDTSAGDALGFEEKDLVVIGHFETQTGGDRFEDLVNIAFRIGLEQSRYAHIMPDEQVNAALQRMERPYDSVVDRALGIEICKREGAKALITGAIVKIGETYALNSTIIDPHSGLSAFSTNATAGSENAIIAAIDEITRNIRSKLGESLATIENTTRLEKVTTGDLEALRAYSLAIRRALAGERTEAQQLLSRALAIDPKFAMAHAKMASIFIFQQDYAKALHHLDRAFESSDRLTDFEKLYVQGWIARLRGTPQEVVETWSLMSSLYPGEVAGHQNAGNAYFFFYNQYDKAALYFQKAVAAADPSARTGFYLNLAISQLALGRYEEALESARETAPSSRWSIMAACYLAARNYKEALALVEEKDSSIAGQGASLELWSQIHADRGDLGQALTEAQAVVQIAHDSGPKELANTLNVLALSRYSTPGEVFRGELARITPMAESVFQTEVRRLGRHQSTLATAFQVPVPTLALIGKVDARNSAIEDAKTILAWIAPLAEDSYPVWLAYVRMLEGEILVAQGQHEKAAALFREALGHAELFQLHESLARLYESTGRMNDAVGEHEWLLNNRGRAFVDCYFGCEVLNIVAWNLAAYRLGRAHEEAGSPQDAVRYYQTFLDSWPADTAQVPETQDAQKRLQRLLRLAQ